MKRAHCARPHSKAAQNRRITRRQAQKGRCIVPSHLSRGPTFVLIGVLLSATPAALTAKPHGAGAYGHPRAYGGRYVTPYAYGGYPAYYGGRYGAYPRSYGYGGYYPRYYGYGGYYGHHHHHNNNAWIAVGAGALGVMLGALLARPRVYPYPYQPYVQQPYVQQQPYVEQAPQQAPQMQQCPDGSAIPAGSYCPEPRRPRG